MSDTYTAYLARKAQLGTDDGFTAADSIARRDTVDAGSTRAYNPAAGGDGNG